MSRALVGGNADAWPGVSGRTVSLLEMIRFSAPDLILRLNYLNLLLGKPDDPKDEMERIGKARESIEILANENTRFRLPLSALAADRMAQEYKSNHAWKWEEFANDLDEMLGRMRDEMLLRIYFFIPTENVCVFDCNLFGQEVIGKFSSAVSDLDEAGKCLALERNTACVFHLMRAMEIAVQTIGTSLGITNVDREWGKILSDIDFKIQVMPKGRGKDESSAVKSNLYHVKQAWRNSTMHPITAFTANQAKDVYLAVKAFMVHLSRMI